MPKISAMDSLGEAPDDGVVPVVHSGDNYTLTVQQLVEKAIEAASVLYALIDHSHDSDAIGNASGVDGETVSAALYALDSDKADATELEDYLPLAGGTMTGDINMGGRAVDQLWYLRFRATQPPGQVHRIVVEAKESGTGQPVVVTGQATGDGKGGDVVLEGGEGGNGGDPGGIRAVIESEDILRIRKESGQILADVAHDGLTVPLSPQTNTLNQTVADSASLDVDVAIPTDQIVELVAQCTADDGTDTFRKTIRCCYRNRGGTVVELDEATTQDVPLAGAAFSVAANGTDARFTFANDSGGSVVATVRVSATYEDIPA